MARSATTASAQARGPLPVTVLAGYLGAGKTSLLNHLLTHPRGLRIAAVVNDFGDVGIDPMLVSTSATAVYATSGGCFCCVLDSEDDLHPLLTRLARRGAGVDAVLLEASGLADPQALARRVADHPATVLAGIVQVVDAVETEGLLATHPSLARHIAGAGLVVVTKADLVEDVAPVLAQCRRLNPQAPVVATVDGALDPRLVLDAAQEPTGPQEQLLAHAVLDEDEDEDGHRDGGICAVGADRADSDLGAQGADGTQAHDGGSTSPSAHPHLHHSAQSLDLVSDAPVDPGALMDLLDDRPTGLFRVKGVVHLAIAPGQTAPVVVHAAGRQVRIDVLHETPDATSRLVVIGSGLDLVELRRRLDACRATPETAPPEADLARVRRATVRPGRHLDPRTAPRSAPPTDPQPSRPAAPSTAPETQISPAL